jgi:hypothetical protein
LRLVDNHEPAQGFKSGEGALQPPKAPGILKIEVLGLATLGQIAGERGLSALAGAHEGHGGVAPKARFDAAAQSGSVDDISHHRLLSVDSSKNKDILKWKSGRPSLGDIGERGSHLHEGRRDEDSHLDGARDFT